MHTCICVTIKLAFHHLFQGDAKIALTADTISLRKRERERKVSSECLQYFLAEHEILMGTTPKEPKHDKYPSKS